MLQRSADRLQRFVRLRSRPLLRGEPVASASSVRMTRDMAMTAVPVLTSYVAKSGGKEVASLLAGVLK
jgi:hypothetical protein